MDQVFIIAEIGVNHNGSMETAKKMIVKAKEVGADAVKFQTFVPELLATKESPKAAYQHKGTKEDQSQLEMLHSYGLSFREFEQLKLFCDQEGVPFLSAPFDLESIAFLERLDVSAFKIPSGEITNLPYLERIAQCQKKIILSTGMATLGEVESALGVFEKSNFSNDIVLLHCTSEYPTPYEVVNLRAMQTLGRAFQLPYGYSDHTQGVDVSIGAVALGATVIEKHFTLDNDMPGPDHQASLNPIQFRKMVEGIRHIELALGTGRKEKTKGEEEIAIVARKSIVCKKNIVAGTPFTVENMTTKRPGNGISPMRWYEVLGKIAKRDFVEDELIEL